MRLSTDVVARGEQVDRGAVASDLVPDAARHPRRRPSEGSTTGSGPAAGSRRPRVRAPARRLVEELGPVAVGRLGVEPVEEEQRRRRVRRRAARPGRPRCPRPSMSWTRTPFRLVGASVMAWVALIVAMLRAPHGFLSRARSERLYAASCSTNWLNIGWDFAGERGTNVLRPTRNVPKEQASGAVTEATEPPTPMAEATEPGPGTLDRNRVIRCRLPLRDDRSMPSAAAAAQSGLSPNFASRNRPVHTPSTVGTRSIGPMVVRPTPR